MAKSFIDVLPPAAKKWAAISISGMISADGVVTSSELELLREMIDFLDNAEDINEIVNMVKDREKPRLQILKTDRKTASKILMSLATVAITDDKLSQPEIEYFKYVGAKIGFDEKFANRVMDWGKDLIALNKRKKNLLKQAEEMIALYDNR